MNARIRLGEMKRAEMKQCLEGIIECLDGFQGFNYQDSVQAQENIIQVLEEWGLSPKTLEREPLDGDLVTRDYVMFYRYNMGRTAFIVADGQLWQDAANRFMDEAQYWPDVWLEEERGGFRNLTLEGP